MLLFRPIFHDMQNEAVPQQESSTARWETPLHVYLVLWTFRSEIDLPCEWKLCLHNSRITSC